MPKIATTESKFLRCVEIVLAYIEFSIGFPLITGVG